MAKNTSPSYTLELDELLNKLKKRGFSKVIDCLINHESDCYTRKGRLNKSSTCRKLNWKPKKLEEILNLMRMTLYKEFELDLEELKEKLKKNK